MALRRTEGATLFLSRSLALPESDAPSRRPVGFPAGYEALAVVGTCLLIATLVIGAFWAGRMVEQRSEFAKALVLAPALEDIYAATRFQDSVSMQFVLQMGRLRRHP